MARTMYYPHEESVTLVAGTQQTVTVKGPNVPGFTRYRLDFFSHDEGKAGGATIQDVRVKIIPKAHTNALGGNQFHTVYGVPTPGTSNRHMLPCGGVILDADEDVDVTLVSAAGGTINFRLERTLLAPDA